MQYLLLICAEPDIPDEAWQAAPDIDGWLDSVATSRVTGHQLQGVETARTVRVRDGEVLVTDGPFTETREWIAGFDVLDCPDMETAIRLASGHPVAHVGRIEVRPFHQLEAESSRRGTP